MVIIMNKYSSGQSDCGAELPSFGGLLISRVMVMRFFDRLPFILGNVFTYLA